MSKIDILKRYYHYYGMKMLLLKLFRNHSAENFDYDSWLKKNAITEAELEKQKKYEFAYNPKISIIVPTYETPEMFLREMIESVQQQTYSNWELCIADGSVSDQVMQVIQAYAQADKRIIVKKLTKNKGIADNTNVAIAIASGEYIALLDHDDLLAPDALFEVVRCVNDNEKADVIYSDEDKITADSARRFEPHFKTDFNIELLRSNNYICHLFVVKRLIVEEIGGFRNDFDGAQDYDLILRCIEKADGGLHCDFLEGKIPGGLVAHQGGYLAGQLPEILAAGLLFAHQGDLVLDEGMIEDLGFKGLRHVFSSCDSIGNGCVVTE